ncbi:carbohydrate ABC transporter permease [Micromonospora sagamiensis]|uniref:Multiple sugar transport system permease protein n=1 Tax=Micromonospora sagamiensis TaxID=47875 RepID=A0A562WFV3_9ACTN|nr:sugar ABC transporter permease [Micromonospora sagamiensis]TWJ28434.1 multiple sugar transport system permease protein [Micromonospora sagamiensis]BCL12675.1 sugar ABC transporter permease [Micromonospora sagamiensis]
MKVRSPSGRRAPARRPGRTLAGWGFALPFAIPFTIFMVGPVLVSLAMSFTDIRSADLRDPLAVELVGLDNYLRLLDDELFGRAVRNTAVVVLAGVPLTVGLGLAVALGLNSGLTRFTALFRVGYYLPVVTSIVAISVVWRFVYQQDSGLLNGALGLVGVDGPNWLADTTLALPALIVMIVWRGLGFQMVIFLAGLQAIPAHLYEAARLDGASTWQQFRHITLPSLRPTLLLSAVIGTVGLMLVFEEPFVMTRGGPLHSTLSVSQYVYSQFGFGNYGYASAMSYVLFLAVAVLGVGWFRLLRSDG